eukprot:s639_g8.t1
MRNAVRQALYTCPNGFSRNPSVQQPLESESCPSAVVKEHDSQAIPSFPAIVDSPCAVIDTGCQRSAVGRNTLERIAKNLPPGLSIKFQSKRFRFSGIGGETTTSQLALIPVCFGSRPGVVHAAVLEDTPDAPFLLSLPIMKELDAVLHLSDKRMHFQALQEFGMMFFNVRGQLCLRLFDFDALSPECHDPQTSWKPRKIVGDECQVADHVIKRWSRMFSRIRIQVHLEQVVKVLISLAIPLMSMLKQVLAVMIRVADPEEMDVIQDLVSSMVQDKKQVEKGRHRLCAKDIKDFNQSNKSKASTSLGSFEVISESSRQSRKSKAASSSQQHSQEVMNRMCFCGLTPQLLTCRKEGPNFMRRFYRCPKPYQHQTQCEYFAWTEDTKAEEYEKMYYQNASMDKALKSKSTKKKSRAASSTESNTSDGEDLDLARSPASSSPKTPIRQNMCQHEWNRRGTNAYCKIKTCHRCGRQEILKHKDGTLTVKYVDVSNLKKSGRPRAVSP